MSIQTFVIDIIHKMYIAVTYEMHVGENSRKIKISVSIFNGDHAQSQGQWFIDNTKSICQYVGKK